MVLKFIYTRHTWNFNLFTTQLYYKSLSIAFNVSLKTLYLEKEYLTCEQTNEYTFQTENYKRNNFKHNLPSGPKW